MKEQPFIRAGFVFPRVLY